MASEVDRLLVDRDGSGKSSALLGAVDDRDCEPSPRGVHRRGEPRRPCTQHDDVVPLVD